MSDAPSANSHGEPTGAVGPGADASAAQESAAAGEGRAAEELAAVESRNHSVVSALRKRAYLLGIRSMASSPSNFL